MSGCDVCGAYPARVLRTGGSLCEAHDIPKTVVCPRCRRAWLMRCDVDDFATCPTCKLDFLLDGKHIVKKPTSKEGKR